MEYTLQLIENDKKRSIKAEKGSNMLKILQQEGYIIPAPCGGGGSCGKCKIKILDKSIKAEASEKDLLTDKEIKAGVRLSCCHNINQDLKIEIPNFSDVEVLTDGVETAVDFDPKIYFKNIEIKKASLNNQKDTFKKIKDKYSEIKKIEVGLIKKLPLLEKENVNLIINTDKIIDIKKSNDKNLYGIAVDIGTTTIAFYLLNLLEEKELAVYSTANPQQKYGADVVTRINYTLEIKDGAKKMQQEITTALNQGIDHLLKKSGVERENIYQLTAAGNTVMLHFLLGVSAESIAKAPYVPVFREEIELKAAELGIKLNKNAYITLLPSIASYVGADITADLLVTAEEKVYSYLMIDIGTNGEIILKNDDKLYACSAAAGPAFEGAKITHGSAGVAGAVSVYSAAGYQTIANQKANGICGSGLFDLIAYLLENNYLKKNGAFKFNDLDEKKHQKLIDYQGEKAFLAVPAAETENGEDIVLTQKDIREFQLAKGAVAAGINLLLEKAEIKAEELDKIYLAGGFGSYIDPESALKVGLIPGFKLEDIIKIGNGAGLGTKIYLLDKKKKLEAAEIAATVEYIELSKSKEFQQYFMESMIFNRSEING